MRRMKIRIQGAVQGVKEARIKRGTGEHQVVEVGMVRKVVCVKQGDLIGGESRSGVRAPIVVMKRL